MEVSSFKELVEDHNNVKLIIENLLNATNLTTQKRKKMLSELKNKLKWHEQIEERLVYPVFKEKKLTHDLTMKAYQEHHVVNALLAELESLELKDETWKAKLAVLQGGLLRHIQEEEEDLFTKANKVLTNGELTAMEASISEAKNCSNSE